MTDNAQFTLPQPTDLSQITSSAMSNKQQQAQPMSSLPSFNSLMNTALDSIGSPNTLPTHLSRVASGGPPGLPRVQPKLVDPSQIQWFYLDPNGTQQGPYDGMQMQSWYQQGYFQSDLRIRRDGQTSFTTIGEYVNLVGDYQYPFTIPLPEIQRLPDTTRSRSGSQFFVSASEPDTKWAAPTQDSGYVRADELIGSNMAGLSLEDESVEPTGPDSATFEREVTPEVAPAANKFAPAQPPSPVDIPARASPVKASPVTTPARASPARANPVNIATPAKASKVAPSPTKPAVHNSETVMAPWAKKRPTPPTKSLDEIRKEEEDKLRKQQEAKRVMEEADKELATRLALADSDASPLPSTARWTNASARPVKPTKSLDEIRKEQLRAEAAKTAALKQQQTIAQSISKPHTSSGNDNSWTVVSNKKTTATSRAESKRVGTQSANLSPTALRNISSQQQRPVQRPVQKPVQAAWKTPAAGKPPTAESDQTSDAQQFLSWSRQQLQGLYPSVNKEDVLSIILQLPSGIESREIIADTIYSNSSTLDGRQFAANFIQRRTKVEEYVVKQGYDFNWQELLSTPGSSPEAGWDTAFTKVTSKRSRRRR